MAKKFPMKGAGITGDAGKTDPSKIYKQIKPATTGGNALETQHSVTKGKNLGGTAKERHAILKPNGNSGTTGSAQPLKSFKGAKGREQRGTDNPLGKIYKRTKPSK